MSSCFWTVLITVKFFLSSSWFSSINKLVSFYNRVIEWFASKGTFKDYSVKPRLSSPILGSVLICLVKCLSLNFFLSFLVSFFLVLAIWSLPHSEFALTSFPNTMQRSKCLQKCLLKHQNLGKKSLRKIIVIFPTCGKMEM